MSESPLRLPGRKVVLQTTQESDLPHVLALWNCGEVMRWVGFPEGLGYDADRLRRWHEAVSRNPDRRHFSIHSPELGYCGEAHCSVDRRNRRGSLDIKLLPHAQGGGRSRDAFLTLIRWVFGSFSEVDAVWTEPSPANLAARTLYYSCGLRPAPRPADLEPYPSYWELTRERFETGR